jgi:tryptophan synthase beta chain
MLLPVLLMKLERPILFNLSGHGHFDISAYEKYFENNLPDHELSAAEIEDALSKIEIPV